VDIKSTKEFLGLQVTVNDLASDLLDRVVDNEAQLLANGDAKFSDEQVRQAQIMTRRDIVLIASYLHSNANLTSEMLKSIKIQNRVLLAILAAISFQMVAYFYF